MKRTAFFSIKKGKKKDKQERIKKYNEDKREREERMKSGEHLGRKEYRKLIGKGSGD